MVGTYPHRSFPSRFPQAWAAPAGPCPPCWELSHLPEQLWVREFTWDALQPWSHRGDSSRFPGANPVLREARCPRRVAGQRAVPVPSLRAQLPWAGHSRAPGPLCCGSIMEGPTGGLAGLSEPLPSVIRARVQVLLRFPLRASRNQLPQT